MDHHFRIERSDKDDGWVITGTDFDKLQVKEPDLGVLVGEYFAATGANQSFGKTTLWPLANGEPGILIVESDTYVSRVHNCWAPSSADRDYRRDFANELRRSAECVHRALCCETGWEFSERSRGASDIEDFLTWSKHDCEKCRRQFTETTCHTYWALGHYVLDFANALAAQLDAEQPVAVAWQSTARDLIESCGQVLWLIDDLAGRSGGYQVATRLARMLLVEHKNLDEAERHDTPDPQERSYFDALCTHLGFTVSRKGVRHLRIQYFDGSTIDQVLPAPSKFPSFVIDAVAAETDWTVEDWDRVYGKESAVTHSRPFRVRNFRRADRGYQLVESAHLIGLTLAALQVTMNRLGYFVSGRSPIAGMRVKQRGIRRTCIGLRDAHEEVLRRSA